MDNIIIRNRKEEFKELVLYTFFGNMTFVISIGSYAIFNVFFGINELIANALAWVFAVLFSYVTNKKWVFKAATPTKTAFLVQMFAFFIGRFITLVIEAVSYTHLDVYKRQVCNRLAVYKRKLVLFCGKYSYDNRLAICKR